MVCEDTLKVKNLPKDLTDAEKEEFLKHFGASKVKIITSKAKQKSVAYARFDSKEIAKEVLFRLHQTYILKNRLCVEYAEQDLGPPKIKKIEAPSPSNKNHFKSFINKLNSFNNSVDFQQPPPAHLKYAYPKANRVTINNIGHALATVPKFYTQVLHLMNRMNLPPPFAVPDPARQPSVAPQKIISKPESSSESELESDEDSKQIKEIIPQKRKLPQPKAIKRPKFIKNLVGTTSSKSDRVEDVFETSDVQVQRKIEMKVSASALEARPDSVERIGVIESVEQVEATKASVVTEKDLAANQIPGKDLDVLPVFKNYHPGAPSCRLYIKNIAKTVEIKDLEFIYNRYKNEGIFDIKLMQEGRMKGQAFVTLDSVEVAQRALKETNAYILKDKPLVVVFAKSVAVKK